MGVDDLQRWDTIELLPKGSYAVLKINRESKRNAMNRSARRGMLQALEHVRGKFRVVVLTGTGTTFCAGIDLKERGEDVARDIHTASQEWADVNVAIRQHSSVFVAAVNGTALGGGVTLVNVCDLAIAANSAEFGMPEIGFATYPGLAGPSTQLSLGRKRVSWMMLTGRRISAAVAAEWGLINECVPASDLMSTAEGLAERIANFDAIALAACKQALDMIPAAITDWRQAFHYGEQLNSTIRLRRANANPFQTALPPKT